MRSPIPPGAAQLIRRTVVDGVADAVPRLFDSDDRSAVEASFLTVFEAADALQTSCYVLLRLATSSNLPSKPV
jgi:hypothetical protein